MKKNLLMLSTSEWDAPHWFRRQHFARCLQELDWRVLYVNPRKTITRALLENPIACARASLCPALWQLPLAHERLAVFQPPPTVPYYVRNPLMAKLGRALYKKRLHAVAHRFFDAQDYIQVVYHPYDRYSINPGLPLVYDVVDKFDAYPEYKGMGKSILKAHMRLCDLATVIIATVKTLVPEGYEHKARIVPNGVDLSAFEEFAVTACPDDLAPLCSPRAIYVGAILDWFDYELLCKTATRLQDVNFVIIGFPGFHCENRPPNVHYLGRKRQTELPAYLRNCQVGIIPFKPGVLTENVNPLKFYEYLAADIPCVSVPMCAIEPFAAPGVLSVATDDVSFADAIRMQLRHRHGEGAGDARRMLAQEHDWKMLSRSFSEIISGAL